MSHDQPISGKTVPVVKPPQFRLRTMLIGVAAICVLLAVMVAVGMFWAMGLMMFVLLVAAHVVGNSLGTQLRDRGSQLAGSAEESAVYEGSRMKARPVVREWQPPSVGRMQEKQPIGWLLIGLSLLGAVASGVVGGLLISSLYWDRIGIAAIVVAALASGVIGGMFLFVTGSFIDMARRTWREATAEVAPPKKGAM